MEQQERSARSAHGHRPTGSMSITSPKMPAAFQLLNRKPFKAKPVPESIANLEPVPILPETRLARPTHRRIASRSCENVGIAFSTPAEARMLQRDRSHVRDASQDADLADVLDLYHERDSIDSDRDADREDDQISIPSLSETRPPSVPDSSKTLVDHDTLPAVHTSMLTNDAKDELRDRYGFRCASQHISADAYIAWRDTYREHLTRRRKKWDMLLQESGLAPADNHPIHFPARSTKLQRYVRKGIPPEYRGQAWFFYAGGPRKLRQHAGLYHKLVDTPQAPDDLNVELIERDLHRTFPDNAHFKPPGYLKPMPISSTAVYMDANEPTLIASLRRVLQAFALYRPQVGYCQSLNFLAGMFLLFLDEEKSFWMLVIVTTEYLPHVHDTNLEGANIDQAVLMLSIRESLPAIWSKMNGDIDGNTTQSPPSVHDTVTKLPPITLVTAAWFMSIFIGTLPVETTLRVWDCFFYEGAKVLFRISLTILKLGEAKVLAAQEFIEIFQIVQSLPKDMLDPNTLMESCFRRRNGVGHLSQKDVDARRDKVAKLRQRGMKNRESRDDLRLAGSRQVSAARSIFKR